MDDFKITRDMEFEKELINNARPFVSKSDILNINASSVCSCIRAAYYSRTGEPDERDNKGPIYFTFFMGNIIEEGIAKLLSHIRVDKGKCRIRDYETDVSGEVDRVIMEYIDGEMSPVLVEVKTMNEFSYRKAYKELVEQNKIREDHYLQIQTYMMLEYRFKRAKYILVNRNMVQSSHIPNIVVFNVERDFDAEMKIRKWISDLDFAVKNNSLPERQYNLGDWQCEYCSYKKKCRKGILDEK